MTRSKLARIAMTYGIRNVSLLHGSSPILFTAWVEDEDIYPVCGAMKRTSHTYTGRWQKELSVKREHGIRQESGPGLMKSLWFGIRGKPRTLVRDQLNFIYTIFVPIISAFFIIRVIPILIILMMSFTNYTIRRPRFKWIALKNFARLFGDLEFVSAFWNSLE